MNKTPAQPVRTDGAVPSSLSGLLPALGQRLIMPASALAERVQMLKQDAPQAPRTEPKKSA